MIINKIRQKIQEGFTLVEILIVVVIVGILATIAIPAYFSYVERAYASDAKTQIKTLLEECKIWKTTHEDFPADVQEMIDEGFGNIQSSTLRKWGFEIDLQQSAAGGSNLEGSINATRLEEMPGGVDKKVCFDVETGVFTGYGTKDECAT